MEPTAWIAVVGLSVGVLVHIVSTVWWAAKITTILSTLQANVADMASEVKASRQIYISREEVAKALAVAEKEKDSMWKRIDSMREDLSALRELIARNHSDHK